MTIFRGKKFLRGRQCGALPLLLAVLVSAGCFPAGETVYQPRQAPVMYNQPAQQDDGYWRQQYVRNRPELPETYRILPKPPRNNEYAEFDGDLFMGMDSQPPLPTLPADEPNVPALTHSPVPVTGTPPVYASGPVAPAPELPPHLQPTSLPNQAGFDTGTHFYPIEQLVYGGDYPDIDKPEFYRLMPKDVITIMVKDHPEFSGQVEIQPDGTIKVPNAPDLIDLRGLTAEEAANALCRALSVYIKGECKVRIQANRAKGGYYFVFGEVRQPGRFPMGIEPIRLTDAVLAANWELNPGRRDMDGEELGPSFPAATPRGSFNAPGTADLARVVLITPHRSQPVRTMHDVRSALLGVTGDNPVVRPGQIIVVPSLIPSRNQNLGEAAPPPDRLPGREFGYNDTPAALPGFSARPTAAPVAGPGYPGDSSWIETVAMPPEVEEVNLVVPPVDSNMAAAFETSMNTSAAQLRQGVTVEGPTVIHLDRNETLAQPPAAEPRRKTVVTGRRGTADGWEKGF